VADKLFEKSPRGAGVLWGEKATKEFLEKNNLKLIIRAHQYQAEGHHVDHDGKVITLFSCSNYTGKCGNKGAIMQIGEDIEKTKVLQY